MALVNSAGFELNTIHNNMNPGDILIWNHQKYKVKEISYRGGSSTHDEVLIIEAINAATETGRPQTVRATERTHCITLTGNRTISFGVKNKDCGNVLQIKENKDMCDDSYGYEEKLTRKLVKQDLSDDDRLLQELNIVSSGGTLTSVGNEFVLHVLLKENKEAIVKAAKLVLPKKERVARNYSGC